MPTSICFFKVAIEEYHRVVVTSFMKWIPISAAGITTGGVNLPESSASGKATEVVSAAKAQKARQQAQRPLANYTCNQKQSSRKSSKVRLQAKTPQKLGMAC